MQSTWRPHSASVPTPFSVPRIKRAEGIDPNAFSGGIDDDTFAKIVACIRIAVPYTGMIISTRESKETRERVLGLGISQISGGSRTSVGGYCEPEPEDEKTEQFDVSDKRTLDEVVRWLMELGYIPSFCTACYREGRTGDRFMAFCKSGQILNFCHPNALMTLQEYLLDYASPETRKLGEALIKAEIKKVPNDKIKAKAIENLEDIKNGKAGLPILNSRPPARKGIGGFAPYDPFARIAARHPIVGQGL